MKFTGLKNKVSKLTPAEKKELMTFLKNSFSVFDDYATVNQCPFCQSKKFIKHDNRNNVVRYLCKDCHKTFTYKTNTILTGIYAKNLHKWNAFVEDFMSLNIAPLDEICNKLDISKQTAFNWRHKLIASLDTKGNTKFSNESIEFDETYFLISRKGRQDSNHGYKKLRYWRKSQVGDSKYNVKVFFTYGRDSKQLELTQSHMGRTSANDLKNYFTANKFDGIRILSDSHPTYKSFFKNNGFDFDTFTGKYHIKSTDRTVHNQTVNAYVRNFKDFVNKHLHGVSTKYLTSYAKWFEFVCQAKAIVKQELQSADKIVRFNITENICENVVSDRIGLELFRQAEYSFIRFLTNNNRSNFGNCKNHYYSGKIAC